MSRFFPLMGAIAVAAFATAAAHAHSPEKHTHGVEPERTDFGQQGDPKKPARTIEVAMRELDDGKMLFVPDRVEVRKGEQIRFVLTNEGQFNHEFILGTERDLMAHAVAMKANPHMEHDDAHSKLVAIYMTDELLWQFTKAGEFKFACLIPGHLERGMIGTILVK